jgi:photosystem II stability/assembly factor-like uncharacterized protein
MALACVALTALAGCGPAASTPGTASAEAIPPSAHLLSGSFGFSGASSWLLSTAGLSTSDDGGRTWTVRQLPDGAGAASVAAVASAPGRRIWLAVPGTDSIELYSMPLAGSVWSNALLVPTWPAEAAGGGPPNSMVIAPGPGALVAVAATITPNGTGSYSTVFVSTDDGDTFVQHPGPAGSLASAVWTDAAFVTAQSGMVVTGGSPAQLIFTADAGASWSKSSTASLPPAGSYFFGVPVIAGSDIELPLIGLATGTGGKSGATFSLLVSHDGGATFEGPLGSTLALDTYGRPATGSLGGATWVAPYDGGRVYETADEGRTWTAVAASGLPLGVSSIDLTGPASATALIGLAGCPGFQEDCWTRSYVVVTSDGGRTWSPA